MYRDWVTVALEDIVVPKGLVRGPFGGALKKSFFTNSGHKVYEQKNAIYKSINLGSYYIDDAKFNELIRFSVQADDFIVSCSGTIGRIFRIPHDAPSGVINQALLKITLDERKILPSYFNYYFNWPRFQSKIIDSTQGGAMQNLVGMEIFRKTELTLPPLDLQKKISSVLGIWDEYLEKLDKKIELKKNIKKGLMQDLLTGRKRLSGFMDEWDSVELGDIAEVSMGQSPLSESYNNSGDGYVLIQGNADMKAGKTIERVWTTSSTKVAPEGSLIMTVRAPVGKIAFSASEVCIGRGVCAITGGYTRLLYYYLEHMNNLWSRYIQGSTFESVNGSDIRGMKLLVPSRNEADAICNVLDTASKELEQLSLLRNLVNKQRDYLLNNLISGKIRAPENLTVPAKEVQYA